jgi:hypothetical protein
MNHTAKIDPAPSSAIEDDVMDEMENNEATEIFEYKPESEQLTDAEILDDGFLDGYEDLDATDVLDTQFSFVPGEE